MVVSWKKVGAGEVGWDTTKKKEAEHAVLLDDIEVSDEDENDDDMEELVYVDPTSLQEGKEEEWRRENMAGEESEDDSYETDEEAEGVDMDVEDVEDYAEKEARKIQDKDDAIHHKVTENYTETESHNRGDESFNKPLETDSEPEATTSDLETDEEDFERHMVNLL